MQTLTGMDQMDSKGIAQMNETIIEQVLKSRKLVEVINALVWFLVEITMIEINHLELQVLSKIFLSLFKKPELAEEWLRTTKYFFSNKLLKKLVFQIHSNYFRTLGTQMMILLPQIHCMLLIYSLKTPTLTKDAKPKCKNKKNLKIEVLSKFSNFSRKPEI